MEVMNQGTGINYASKPLYTFIFCLAEQGYSSTRKFERFTASKASQSFRFYDNCSAFFKICVLPYICSISFIHFLPALTLPCEPPSAMVLCDAKSGTPSLKQMNETPSETSEVARSKLVES